MTSKERVSQPIRSKTDRADGFESRNRGLSVLDAIFKVTKGPAFFLSHLLERNDGTSALDVLEVGFGWGFALLELAWLFRDQPVKFYGVDIEEKKEFNSPRGIRDFAISHGIVPRKEADKLPIPNLFAYDASTIHFENESMDFIYSAVTIRFIKRKIEFIEDVSRVLRPGGIALLHLGESNWNYPYSAVCDQRILTPYTSRLVLKYRDELIPLPTYLAMFEGPFDFYIPESSRLILVLSKLESGTLDFDLTLNEELTISGRKLPLLNRKGEVRGGIRSVYDLSDQRYSFLFDRGLLSRKDLRRDLTLPATIALPPST